MRMILAGLIGLVFVGSAGARIFTSQDSQAPASGGSQAERSDPSSSGSTAPRGLGSGFAGSDASQEGDAAQGSQLLPKTDEEPPKLTSGDETTALEQYLPLLTEVSFFALLGFALGYFSRKVVKIALIVIAVIFLGVLGLDQIGAFKGGIDWEAIQGFFNRVILNLKENTPVTEFLTNRIPAVGALLGGIILGFRRG